LRMAVNIPVNALAKLAVADIVQTYRPRFEKWPGLIIDVAEEHIVPDLAFAKDFTEKMAHLNVRLAIDDFGRGYSALARLEDMIATSSPDAAPTRSMPRCARPPSIWRIISAPSPQRSESTKHRMRSLS